MKIVIELKDKKDIPELLFALQQGGLAVEHDWLMWIEHSKAQKRRTKSIVKRVSKQLYVKNLKILEP